MNKIEILFIRACKSLEPQRRVLSAYCRFYGKYTDPEKHIILVLADICDLYAPMRILDLIANLDPRKIATSESQPYSVTALRALIYHLRFCNTKKLPGYSPPTRFLKHY